jgi:predicted nucleic acid-binding protein
VSVIVDTSVWSLALRRATPRRDAIVDELGALITEGRIVMLGPVRQEILSGIRAAAQFRMLRDRLRAFPDLGLTSSDYEDAADAFNACRRRGIQGSNTDFLICAAAIRRDLPIFTTDGDFLQFERVLPIRLHESRN